MPVATLKLTNFRHFSTAELTPLTEGFTWLMGHNASGKTSLLEALYCLSAGRSFRTSQHIPLIKQDAAEFVLYAELQHTDDSWHAPSSLGMQRNRSGDMKLHINGESVPSLSSLASLLPTRAIHSQSHNMFELGPSIRRKYLDWGLFYHYPAFWHCWRTYEHVLKQRNQLLRMQKAYSSEIKPWTDALLQAAEELNSLRKQYVEALLPYFFANVMALLPDMQFEIEYLPGWSKQLSVHDALSASLHDEARAGYTVIGPHKADLAIHVDGVPVKQFLSRGQQKLLICAMIIAQGSLCFQVVGKQLVYLVDDLTSELDLDSAKRLLTVLSQQQAQVFISAITSDEIMSALSNCPVAMKMFHVKHQRIEEQSL